MKAFGIVLLLAFCFQSHAEVGENLTELRMHQDIDRFNQEYYVKDFQSGTSGYTHGRKTKTVIVLIHGLFSSGRFFSSSALDLYKKGYNVLNLTLPGHEMGQMGAPLQEYRRWLDYTDTLLKYARTWGDRVVVVGHSFGGALAVLASEQNLVDGLILLQPALKVTSFSYGLSVMGQAVSVLRPEDRRMRFMTGTAETAFQFWNHQPHLSQLKIKVPTLLYSSRIDPIVSEAGHLEFATLNPDKVELVRHFQIHMTNMLRDSIESQRIQNFLQRNFPL